MEPYGYDDLINAADSGDLDLVRNILQMGRDPNVQDDEGYSALLMASANGHIDVVHELIEAGADPNLSEHNMESPLHWAASNGHVECLKLLIEAKALVNIQETNGMAPLHSAAWHGHAECVDALIKAKADVDLKNDVGETPLHWAAQHPACVKLLFNAGAQGVKKPVEHDLFKASIQGDLQALNAGIEAGADVMQKDAEGFTPLHRAAYYGHSDCLQALINGGAGVDVQGSAGRTALHEAAFNGYTDCVGVLLKNGADALAMNHQSQTPVDVAENNEILEQLLDHQNGNARGFKRSDKVADHYDRNPDFADNLIHLLPGFEYPNWSHKTIGEVLDTVSAQHVAVIEESLQGQEKEITVTALYNGDAVMTMLNHGESLVGGLKWEDENGFEVQIDDLGKLDHVEQFTSQVVRKMERLAERQQSL